MTNMNHAFAKALVAERLEEERYNGSRFENLLVNDSLGVGQTRETCEVCGFNTVFTVQVFDRRAHWCGCGSAAHAEPSPGAKIPLATFKEVLESINGAGFGRLSIPQKIAMFECYVLQVNDPAEPTDLDVMTFIPVRDLTSQALDRRGYAKAKWNHGTYPEHKRKLMRLTDAGMKAVEAIMPIMEKEGYA